MIEVKHMYKIHGVNTAMGKTVGARNGTFYETWNEALDAAKSCLREGSNCDGIVIYKAVSFVERERSPIVVHDIRDC